MSALFAKVSIRNFSWNSLGIFGSDPPKRVFGGAGTVKHVNEVHILRSDMFSREVLIFKCAKRVRELSAIGECVCKSDRDVSPDGRPYECTFWEVDVVASIEFPFWETGFSWKSTHGNCISRMLLLFSAPTHASNSRVFVQETSECG